LKVLVTVPWEERHLNGIIAAFADIEFTHALTEAHALEAIEDADIVLGDFSRPVYLAAKQLRWVQCHGAGVNKLMAIPELVASDVLITSTKGAHAPTIAEHFFCMLISLTRQFPKLYAAQSRREWVRWNQWQEVIGARPVGLQGLTLGIVGFGNIGDAIARRAHAFDMHTIAVDIRTPTKPDYLDELKPLEALPELMAKSDAVVVTVPGTPQTAGMLNCEILSSMKRDSYLMAVSRGGVIDEVALAELLNTGHLAGAALDVAEVEPLPPTSPLWDAPNLILTPHIAGKSENTVAGATRIFHENLARFLEGRPLANLVDRELGF
jgi:phosphoglycerate dehydrogenase-like enzyme